jgi:hypothetical protein
MQHLVRVLTASVLAFPPLVQPAQWRHCTLRKIYAAKQYVSPCLIKHQAKVFGGMDAQFHVFLTSALHSGECSSSSHFVIRKSRMEKCVKNELCKSWTVVTGSYPSTYIFGIGPHILVLFTENKYIYWPTIHSNGNINTNGNHVVNILCKTYSGASQIIGCGGYQGQSTGTN